MPSSPAVPVSSPADAMNGVPTGLQMTTSQALRASSPERGAKAAALSRGVGALPRLRLTSSPVVPVSSPADAIYGVPTGVRGTTSSVSASPIH